MHTLTPKEAVQLALRHFEAGHVQQAQSLCQAVLTLDPADAAALQTLGMIARWACLLRTVPHSRLLLKSKGLDDPQTIERFVQAFAEHGIEGRRLSLCPPVPGLAEHLGAYSQVDIALDTFPYCGTTTTCEALWMGVPVVTWAGNSHVSRVGVSLLGAVGLEQLVADTPEAYLELAAGLAGDRARLLAIRSHLRERMRHSPLTDAKGFTDRLENAYRRMWENRSPPARHHIG
jgi:predicted O-linked N-acetylglucosamine transferase (SPINDLY family)